MLRERSIDLQYRPMDLGDLPCSSGRSEGRIFRCGFALLPKKVARYLTSSMITVAHNRGLELVLLDHTKPLLDQGEYDAIVHKLQPNKDWERNLQEYIQARPGVKVIDSLAGIRIVHNRGTMLLPLRERPEGITLKNPFVRQRHLAAGGSSAGGFASTRIQSPTQVEIVEGTSLAEAEALLQGAALRLPLLVKPLWTDGREGSHGLAVLHDMAALGRVLQGGVSAALKPPLVVQQFVEHGGVLFKVYVLGARTVVCQRPSLGDSYLSPEARQAGVLSLPRISCKSGFFRSCLAAASKEGESGGLRGSGMLYDTVVSAAAGGTGGSGTEVLDPGKGRSEGTWADDCGGGEAATHGGSGPHSAAPSAPGCQQEQWTLQQQPTWGTPSQYPQHQQQQHPSTPPDWVTSALAATLRDKLGLQLFNFDMICPEEQPGAPWERLYYVVDINYFPGVDKIPDFENIFVEFLTATCGGAGGDGAAADGDGSCGQSSEQEAQVDVDMGGGEDGVSSISSDKVERLLAADAPAPAAEAFGEPY